MKAFGISRTAAVHFFSEPVNMLRSFPGLIDLVETKLQKKPDSGDLFLFVNKNKNRLKILYWHKDGWNLFAKYLPEGRFDIGDSPAALTLKEMERIIEGVVINDVKKLRRLKAA